MEEKKDSGDGIVPILCYLFVGAVVFGTIAGIFGWEIVGGISGIIISVIIIAVFGYAIIKTFNK